MLAVNRIKTFLSWLLGMGVSFFPVIPEKKKLPWGQEWMAIGDYLSFCLRWNIPFERDERDFLLQILQPGWTFLDIGAHHGWYSLLASHKVGPEGQVIAFDPSPRELARLREHIELNHCTNVHVEILALGEKEGTEKLYICQGLDTGCNSLRKPFVFGKTSELTVPVVTLDHYLKSRQLERIDFVKMDVEGAELSVLKGGEKLFSSVARPLLMFEAADSHTRAWGYESLEILAYLRKKHYDFFSFSRKGTLLALKPHSTLNQNILAVPVEKLAQVSPFIRTSKTVFVQAAAWGEALWVFMKRVRRKIWREIAFRPLWKRGPYEYRFEKAASEWKHVPVDEIGYLNSSELLALSDPELKKLIHQFETIRYDLKGWRNRRNLWREYSGVESVTGKHILDFGCGFGIEALQFAKNKNWVSLADIAPSNLDLAEKVLQVNGFKPVEKVLVSKEAPFFRLSRPIDVFYANGVLHHTPKIREILQEAVKRLNPGGEIRLMLYSDHAWKIATGGEAPSSDLPITNHAHFFKFVRYYDSYGEYADWYNEEKIRHVLGDFLEIKAFHYITKDKRYLMTTLVPKAEQPLVKGAGDEAASKEFQYYRFCTRFPVAVRSEGLPHLLNEQFAPFEDRPEMPVMEIQVCRNLSELNGISGRLFEGRYKGIPWKIRMADAGGPFRFRFYAPYFQEFLVLRMIFIPFLKKQMAENDGFIVSGSGFSYAGKRYVLLGDPGCGKTRFLIQAFERGAKIFGDSELYLFKSGEISGLFKNVEVRYPTVFHTHLWHSLSAVQKGYLFFCHCLSAATFRMISLNLSLPNLVSRFSQEENLSGEPVVFVHIGGGRPVSKLTPEAFIEEITGYEKRCWNSYGEFIFSQTDFAKARESMREIFGKATLWKAPLNTTIDQILTLS